jgi:hypothetical protein
MANLTKCDNYVMNMCSHKTDAVGSIISEMTQEHCASDNVSIYHTTTGTVQWSPEMELRHEGRNFYREFIRNNNLHHCQLKHFLEKTVTCIITKKVALRDAVLRGVFNLKAELRYS